MQGISGRLNPPSPLVAAGAEVPNFRPAAEVLLCAVSRRSREETSQLRMAGERVGRKSAAVGHNGSHYLGRLGMAREARG